MPDNISDSNGFLSSVGLGCLGWQYSETCSRGGRFTEGESLEEKCDARLYMVKENTRAIGRQKDLAESRDGHQ